MTIVAVSTIAVAVLGIICGALYGIAEAYDMMTVSRRDGHEEPDARVAAAVLFYGTLWALVSGVCFAAAGYVAGLLWWLLIYAATHPPCG